MRKIAAMLALLFVGATLATAQTHDMSAMTANQPNLIAGTDATVPDIVPFRLWIEQYAHATDPNFKAGMIRGLRLGDANRAQFTSIVDGYNATAVGAIDYEAPMYAEVGRVLGMVQVGLTPEGLAAFNKAMLHERTGMHISPYDYGLGESARMLKKEAEMVASRVPQGGTQMVPNFSTYFSVDLFSGNYADDSFQRTTGLGSNWTVDSGAFAIVNNQVEVTNGGPGGTAWMYYNAISQQTDGDYALTLGVVPSAGASIGIGANMAASSTPTFYGADFYNNGPWTAVGLFRCSSGSCANIFVSQQKIAAGDVLYLLKRGSSISVIHNGSLVQTYTDPNPLPAGFSGIIGTAGGGYANSFNVASGGQANIGGSISGSASGTYPAGALHTAHVTAEMGNEGGVQNGNPEIPTAYQIVSNYPSFDSSIWDDSGDPVNAVFGASISCNILGANWFIGPGFNASWNLAAGIAITVTNEDAPESAGVSSPLAGHPYAKKWTVHSHPSTIGTDGECVYPGDALLYPDMTVNSVTIPNGINIAPIDSWISFGAVLYVNPGWTPIFTTEFANAIADILWKSQPLSATFVTPQTNPITGVPVVPYPCTKRSVGQTGNPLPILGLRFKDIWRLITGGA